MDPLSIKEIEAKLDGTFIILTFNIAHLKKMMQKSHGKDGSPSKDFLNINKSVLVEWNNFREVKKIHAGDELQAKLHEANIRKKLLDELRRNKNIFQLHKWDIVR